MIENLSSYVEFNHSEMSEWEFLSTVAKRSGCGLLVDVNNIFVSSFNHHFDPLTYLKAIPKEYIGQIHLAGHERSPTCIIDTHDDYVCDEVWELYRWAVQNWGTVNAMVEWDDQIPAWSILMHEVNKIRVIQQEKPSANSVGITANL